MAAAQRMGTGQAPTNILSRTLAGLLWPGGALPRSSSSSSLLVSCAWGWGRLGGGAQKHTEGCSRAHAPLHLLLGALAAGRPAPGLAAAVAPGPVAGYCSRAGRVRWLGEGTQQGQQAAPSAVACGSVGRAAASRGSGRVRCGCSCGGPLCWHWHPALWWGNAICLGDALEAADAPLLERGGGASLAPGPSPGGPAAAALPGRVRTLRLPELLLLSQALQVSPVALCCLPGPEAGTCRLRGVCCCIGVSYTVWQGSRLGGISIRVRVLGRLCIAFGRASLPAQAEHLCCVGHLQAQAAYL